MKNKKSIIPLVIFLFSWIACQAKTPYPRIYVTDADKPLILQKIKKEKWAKESYAKLKEKINVYADRHIDDPQWIVSRLSMYRKEGERYTRCYLKDQNWDRGEGNAPVPTVRMPGMRTWNKYVNVPLEDRIPYNETGDMWGIDKTHPDRPPGFNSL